MPRLEPTVRHQQSYARNPSKIGCIQCKYGKEMVSTQWASHAGICVAASSTAINTIIVAFTYHCRRQLQLRSLNKKEKDKVKQFVMFTNTNESTAIACLEAYGWRLEVASDAYFNNPHQFYIEERPAIDKKVLDRLYHRYKGKNDQ